MPAITNPDLLGEIALFNGATRAELSKLNDLLHRQTLPAGTILISTEQPGEVVYIVTSGAVKVYLDDEDGTEVILAILVAGEIVGEMSLLDFANRSANAVTIEETSIFWMSRASFQECLRTMPSVQNNLTRMLCSRLRLANARIQSLAVQDVEGRVARQLLAFAEICGQETADGAVVIPFRLTQSDLASLVGATRVRVNQVITTYKQRKYISVDSHYRITLLNLDSLGRRAYASVQNADARCSRPRLAMV